MTPSSGYTGSTIWIVLSNTGKDAGGGIVAFRHCRAFSVRNRGERRGNHIIFGIRTRHLPHGLQLSQQGKLLRCPIRYCFVRVIGKVLSAFTVNWSRDWQKIQVSVQCSSPCVQINKTWHSALWVSGCDLQYVWAWNWGEVSMAVPRSELRPLSTESATVLTEL